MTIIGATIGARSPVRGAEGSTDTLAAETSRGSFEGEARLAGAIGFYSDTKTRDVTVVVPKGEASSFRMPPADAIGAAVRVEEAALTREALESTLERLQAVGREHPDDRAGFFFDSRHGTVRFHTFADEATTRARLGELWSNVDYRFGGLVPTSRGNDLPPFWGGARTTSSGGWCTTGFAVTSSSGVERLVTAGHCTEVYNDVFDTTFGHFQGTSTHNACLAHTGHDFLLLSGGEVGSNGHRYQGRIYVGGASGSGASVKSAADPILLSRYYYSGQATYEQGNQEVIDTSASTTTSECGSGSNFAFWNPDIGDGVCETIDGDSGAPFYFKDSNGNILIRGIAVAKSLDGTVCFGEKWTEIKNYYSLTIMTYP
jgi:hypothetical protein